MSNVTITVDQDDINFLLEYSRSKVYEDVSKVSLEDETLHDPMSASYINFKESWAACIAIENINKTIKDHEHTDRKKYPIVEDIDHEKVRIISNGIKKYADRMRVFWFSCGLIVAMTLFIIIHNTPKQIVRNVYDWASFTGWL